ncbi:MAG: hypothetical protein N2257_08605 [Thermodesulfovibrionales bacterium]|nr:hypothetical protein [Thermodesulfovibrionales bacterium]
MKGRPSLIVRLLAKSIDLIVVFILIEVFRTPGFFAGLLYILISDGLFQGRSVGKLLTNLRVVKIESKTGGRAEKGEEGPATENPVPDSVNYAGTRESVIRNSPLFFAILISKIPFLGWLLGAGILFFELIMIVGSPSSRRLGDELAGTVVIEIQ